MKVISGCIIVKNNKILMVKEANKQCYGKWNYPAGHLDELEKITDAAIREVFEETGCKVKLTGVLPIILIDVKNETFVSVKFVAEIIEEDIKFDKNEILDVKWLYINEIKNMTSNELRGYEANTKTLKDFEEGKIYPLELFDDEIYKM